MTMYYGIMTTSTGFLKEVKNTPYSPENLPTEDYIESGDEAVDNLPIGTQAGGTWDKDTQIYTPPAW